MSAPTSRYINANARLDPQKDFQGDDSLISKGDLAWVGLLLQGKIGTEAELASRIVALGHLVTRIVLSERIVFYGDPIDTIRPNSPWSDTTELALRASCDTLMISEEHAAFSVAEEIAGKPTDHFEEALISDVNRAANRFAPWTDEGVGSSGQPVTTALTRVWLAEHAIADIIGVPVAVNPIMSTPFSLHAARALGSADIMTRYIEDLRRETATETNLLREMQIYDLRVPAVFGAVLREAKNPEDLFRVAAQLGDDAKSFRSWCRSLDALTDPKKFNERLRAAQDSLARLELSTKKGEHDRVQVPVPTGLGESLPLPSKSLKRWIDWLDVDIRFVRPRHFLINLLRNARQVASLNQEIARVFRIPPAQTKNATARILMLANETVA